MSCKNFQRRLVVEYLSRSAVETGNDNIHFFLADRVKISSLRKISADESIGGFIRPPLPGTVGIGKIRLHAKLFLQTGVEVMFTAIIKGGGFARLFGYLVENPQLHIAGFPGADPGYFVRKDKAGDSLDLGMESCVVPIPNNRISFPMPKLHPRADRCWPVADRNTQTLRSGSQALQRW
jgi:hypothetical protein